MTTHQSPQAFEAGITEVLAKSTSAVKRTGHGQWSVQISNGRLHRGSARVDGQWFILEMPIRPRRAPASCRHALAAMLLSACRAVRMARAAAREAGGCAAVRFEISLVGPTDADELSRALSALSVSCELCGQEARALQNEKIANAYLSLVRGWSLARRGGSKAT